MKLKSLQIEFEKSVGGRKFSAEGRFEFTDASSIHAVMGASGAGKSTLARWIAGLTKADCGVLRADDCIWFDGKQKICLPSQARQVGFLAQGDLLFPHLTVQENVGFGLRKWETATRSHRIEQMLALTGVGELSLRMPHTLSGGEKRRVALAQALSTDPRVLILDEPFSGLDAEAKRVLWGQTKNWISEYGIPTILITHDPVEARAFTDSIHSFESGHLRID
ncbi:hypothetical protein FACS1894123_11920 [Bacteroidia bacterium]|jgi:ABC-type sulfate/molybdate transport systems ATPase subunit|nr:hypothetical protein FACS1894123_11920 [Bacteroidia bacterium]